MAINQNDFKVKNGLVVSTTATFLTTVTAISTTTGGVRISGGVGIAKDVWIGGTLNVVNPTTATNQSSGALVVSGGVGISGNLYAGNIYSNGALLGSVSAVSTTATNLAGGTSGQIPYQWDVGVTTFTNSLVYDQTYVKVNNNPVLTTASVVGQVGISVASTSTGMVYLAFIPGAQGLTADFGLITDPTGPITFDFGTM